MKKKFLIVLGIIAVFLIIYGVIFFIDFNNVSNSKLPIFVLKFDNENYYGLGYNVKVKYYKNTNNIEKMDMFVFGKSVVGVIQCFEEANVENNIIIIEDKKIQNENLLDTFIEASNNKQNTSLQIKIVSNGNIDNITLEYIAGENQIKSNSNSTQNETAPSSEWTSEEYQKFYGYYKLTKNDVEEKFDFYHWRIKRKTQGNTVQVIFNTDYFDLLEIPVIFEYDLDSSLYKKKYDNLTYNQRKDLGIKQIAEENQFDNIDFGLYTFGGDVTVTIEQDMVYSLKDALDKQIITIQNIMEQAEIDEKYGICEKAYYSDGGSVEYRYNDYTILKYNSLNGNRDLIIGMRGTIINDVGEIDYK